MISESPRANHDVTGEKPSVDVRTGLEHIRIRSGKHLFDFVGN